MRTKCMKSLAAFGAAVTIAVAGLVPQVASAQTDGPKVNWKYNVWGK